MENLNNFLVDPDLSIDPTKESVFVNYLNEKGVKNEFITKEHYNNFIQKFVDVRGEITITKAEANIDIIKTYK